MDHLPRVPYSSDLVRGGGPAPATSTAAPLQRVSGAACGGKILLNKG